MNSISTESVTLKVEITDYKWKKLISYYSSLHPGDETGVSHFIEYEMYIKPVRATCQSNESLKSHATYWAASKLHCQPPN